MVQVLAGQRHDLLLRLKLHAAHSALLLFFLLTLVPCSSNPDPVTTRSPAPPHYPEIQAQEPPDDSLQGNTAYAQEQDARQGCLFSWKDQGECTGSPEGKRLRYLVRGSASMTACDSPLETWPTASPSACSSCRCPPTVNQSLA